MTTILDELADAARRRIDASERSFDDVREQALALPKMDGRFRRALARPKMSFICECKRASPSKGIIAQEYPYLDIARDYEAAGADCISVLTEPTRFLGDSVHLLEISSAVSTPCLRKDFTVSPYMVYEAATLGASAVLLICSILDDEMLGHCLDACRETGLDALVEVHDADEVQRAVSAGASIIGVNNRDLKDFSVDSNNTARLRPLVPDGVIFVSESGVRTRDDVIAAERMGADAVLVGETLMRASDRKAKLRELRG